MSRFGSCLTMQVTHVVNESEGRKEAVNVEALRMLCDAFGLLVVRLPG